MSDGKFDPHRRLCPDGACIGVIGDDGRCRVCGRSGGGGGKDAAPAGFVPAGDGEDGDEDGDEDGKEGATAGASKRLHWRHWPRWRLYCLWAKA